MKTDNLTNAEVEPGRIGRTIHSIETAHENMTREFHQLLRKVENFDREVDEQNKRRIEAEKLRKNILEKLELNRQTLEEREKDAALVQANLDKAKALAHDLATRKVEINVKKRRVFVFDVNEIL